MELQDTETLKKPCNVELRVRRCCVSCFQACYDAMNIFEKHEIKNLAEKLKQIGEIVKKVLPTKICKEFFCKVCKQTTSSIIDFCSVFNLQFLSSPALVKAKFSNFLFSLRACAVRSK